MKYFDLSKLSNVQYGKNVKILGTTVNIAEGVCIGDDVKIEAKYINIGFDTRIESGVSAKGIAGPMESFQVGDNCLVGFQNQILVPKFRMRDYSQLHNSGLHSGYKPLEIGYNCWIGQGCILNSTESLQIGNNVRIGTHSQLWTHVASGELLEGCTLFGSSPLILKDNVWIVGGAVISPGLVLEDSSIIMTGSVLTKSTLPKHTYAGIPARDVTDKLNFWKDISIDEKKAKLESFIEEFFSKFPEYRGRVYSSNGIEDFDRKYECLIFLGAEFDVNKIKDSSNTYFNLISKKYTKRRSKIEVDWINFANGFRARFTPYD